MRATLLLLLFAVPLHADGLADVRAALSRLNGRDLIKGTYDVQRVVANDGKFDKTKFTGRAAIEVESDAAGVRLTFSRALLDQVTREQNQEARDPKLSTPTLSAVHAIGPVVAAEVLDFAPRILQKIEGAKVVEDRPAAYAGKPARMVVFHLADKSGGGMGKVTYSENKLTLWLAADNVPVAAQESVRAKYSFLFFKADATSKRNWTFARVGDRLVNLHFDENEKQSGMGQNGDQSVVGTLRVHP